MEGRAHYIRDTIKAHEYSPLEDPTWGIWVVTVRDVSEGQVDVDPLKLQLHVDEVLRSVREQVDDVVVIWKPIDLDAYRLKRPITGPKIGDRLIIFAIAAENDPAYFHNNFVYRFSAENRKTVLDNMVQGEAANISVFWLIMALSFVSLIAFIVRILKSKSQVTATILGTFVMLVPVINWALYDFYKSGLDYHYNIRIDLVILWLALIASLLLWPAMAIRYLLSLRSD